MEYYSSTEKINQYAKQQSNFQVQSFPSETIQKKGTTEKKINNQCYKSSKFTTLTTGPNEQKREKDNHTPLPQKMYQITEKKQMGSNMHNNDKTII